MPNCFQLYRKEDTDQRKPIAFTIIDDELCAHFNQPVGEEYLLNWYNMVGMWLAVGESFDQIKARWQNDAATMADDKEHQEYFSIMFQLIEYLKENFTPHSWSEWGNRK